MYSWGWFIIIYLFLGGLGAGAYLTSFAAEKGWFGKDSNLKRVGYLLAGPSALIGSLLLFLDLGVAFTEPLAVLRMFANVTSVMTWGIYVLTLFIIVGFISAFYAMKNSKVPALLSTLGAVLALATGTYTGVLLSVVGAVPFWNTFLLPVLFVVSALSTGLAATSLFAHFSERPLSEDGSKLNHTHLALVILEFILIFILLAVTISGSKGIAAARSAQIITVGSLAVPFWLLLVGVGLIAPFIYYFSQNKGSNKGQANKGTAMLSELAVLVGGITLRAVVVLSVVRIWHA